ncbi:MAG: phosphatidylserine/phosphatidylglycerophosphate/cardiolipin synthase family protein [Gammaproteobacteria bacterium]|nr:phosphatidylserine/phosphatidylglycerophosphate/cardiolipin synthase family protein [Gammaproteobacteria bacterium]
MEDKTIARRFRYTRMRIVHMALVFAWLAGCATTSDGPKTSKNQQYAQATGHVVKSHTTGVLMRPFSSLLRLGFVTFNTITTTIKPAYPRNVEKLPIPPLNEGPGMDLVEWEAYLDETTRPSTRGTVDLIIDGEEFFTRFADAVNGARESVSLRTYIFDNDDFAVSVGDMLKRRSNEGIDTKVLLDGFGTIISTVEQQENLPQDHEAPGSVRKFLEEGSRVDVRQTQNPWFTGDHVKTAIIDRQIAFTGGMNIAREYRYDWHDLMIELRGPVVDVLQYEFDKAWAYAGVMGDLAFARAATRKQTAVADDIGYPVRTLYTRTESAEIFRVQRKAIQRAQKYVYVQNPYFTDDVMLYELARARKRGVDVRVIIPLETDRGLITRNNALAANALLRNGVRVFIYPGMSHTKAAIYDDWACLGSANWDRWSFYLNKELNIATSEPSVARSLLEDVFEKDFAASVELTEQIPEHWSDYLYEMFGDYFF